MADVTIRPASSADLTRITEIYNHYVINTPITFDLAPLSVQAREPWFREHTSGGRNRLLVAEQHGRVAGFAGTGPFRARAAYDTTVEATIYCAAESVRRGMGAMLYDTLFSALRGEDINRVVAGITLPNDASVALHHHFGFTEVGTFSQNGRKFGRYWDVLWMERPLIVAAR
ncbi:MAG TPA: GNAT family N-acetyltransferase [Candidatus Binataceae bacterium]|nr:GNAT family N-acetyltransferase [Candidatus Binataceae bacterium]